MIEKRGFALAALPLCLGLGPLARAAEALSRPSEAKPASIVPRNPNGNYFVPGVLGDIGYRRVDLTPVLEPLSRADLAWFSIDYRLTPEHRHEQQLDDLRRAIRYVRHHASKFRVDPDRLAMLGESASGQMVAQLASEPCDGIADAEHPVERMPCTVRAAVSFYGVYDFLPLVEAGSPPGLLERLFGRSTLDAEARRLLRRYSPLHRVPRAQGARLADALAPEPGPRQRHLPDLQQWRRSRRRRGPDR